MSIPIRLKKDLINIAVLVNYILKTKDMMLKKPAFPLRPRPHDELSSVAERSVLQLAFLYSLIYACVLLGRLVNDQA